MSDYRCSGKGVCHSEWKARNEKLAGMSCVRGGYLPFDGLSRRENRQEDRSECSSLTTESLQQLHSQDQDLAKKAAYQRRSGSVKMVS